jgi:hypothetical protein
MNPQLVMVSLIIVIKPLQAVMDTNLITHQHNEEVETKVEDLPERIENAKQRRNSQHPA